MSNEVMVSPLRSGSPRPVSATPAAASRAVARSPVLQQVPPAPTVPSSSSTGSASDLLQSIRESLEQDVDYQILRKAFALDEAASSTSWGAPARLNPSATTQSTAAVEATQLSLHRTTDVAAETGGAGWDATTLDLQSSRLQRLTVRLEAGTAAAAETTLAVNQADPLVLDLSGAGLTTTGIENGVRFDLTGDGRAEQVSFVTGDSWLLALDGNANGRIDDGRELFGDQNGAAHGFAELARYDDNADGRIDAADPVFAELRLFQMNAAGEQRLRSLDGSNVVAIELAHQTVRKALDAYDMVAQTGQFRRADGSTGEAADVLLGYRSLA